MIQEPARSTPIIETADVVVCGGGPAGIAAAVAAARTGATVRLLETHGCLGGIWTTGGLSWMLDCRNKTGLMKELIARLQDHGVGHYARGKNFICDPEALKLILERMIQDAAVSMQLHTRVVDAVVTDGLITQVITESKSGRQGWGGQVFIDCTGDGDVGALAGCVFDVGRPGTGETQPLSLIALIGGLDPEEVRPYNNVLEYPEGKPRPKTLLRNEMTRAGVPPSYSAPALFHIDGDRFLLMANHEYHVAATDAHGLTEATLRARAELHTMIDGLRALGGPWRNIWLLATAPQIGVREGRRLHGLYTVTQEDMRTGARHEDGVCRCAFGIDVHSTDPAVARDHDAINRTIIEDYDIPLRALIARGVDGLLMAGRCISGDFLAHSSYRVSGDAVELGQGAGVAAAVAAQTGVSTRELSWARVGPALDRLRAECLVF